MAKRDGDDNLSPEMQAKMQAAKKLQDELNAKLSQFGQIASNKNMSSVKEYDDLEKELLELKKYAASVKNENDAKLNDMINAMNKKMEKMAKTALEEQIEGAKNFERLLNEMNPSLEKLKKVINEFNIKEDKLQQYKTKLVEFQNVINDKHREAQMLLKDADLIAKKMETANKNKLTPEKVGPKIQLVLNQLANIRDAISGGDPPPSLALFDK
ncbi:uncharacterized protein LOC106670106 isoform X7 [Cimex lectularius]|uniref:Uncharacterized protein n=1 Tax=Cimex lectularius TaxID=79782 RepID=A0A8I6S1X9_CIMLE|nr:uncharacterized protein LOC106670106 isoform X7 [Cimex lectularius]